MSESTVTSLERRGSIRRTIVGFSLMLVLLSVFLVGGSGAYFASRSIRERTQSQMAAAAELKENEITRWVNEREGDLAVLATEASLLEQWQTMLNTDEDDAAYVSAYSDLAVRLNDFLRKKIAFVDVSLLNAETGQILVSSEVLREREFHASDDFFLKGRESVYVEAVQLDPVLNAPTLLIARPVEGVDGEVVAVLAGRANLADLSAVLGADIGLGGASNTYLLSKEAAYLAGSLPPGVRLEGIADTLGFQLARAGVEDTAFYSDYNGADVVGAYRWVSPLQVALLIEAPRMIVSRSVMAVFGASMGVALLIGGVAAGLALILTQRIVNPIEQLTQAVTGITRGDLERRVSTDRTDEIGVLAQGFNNMADRLRDLVGTLEQRVASRTQDAERRARQIQTASELSATIAAIRDVDRLLAEVTHRISERFGFYHVGVFLLDEAGEYAVLRAANSVGGGRMLRRGHRLRVGEEGIVGYVTAAKQPRIALDVGEDAVYFDNPDLPETRSEMALPLMAGDRLVGVLDVQSREGSAFTEEDVTVLQGLTGQLAVSIENARLFAESERALEAMRQAYGDVSRESWGRLVQSMEELRYISTTERVCPVAREVQKDLPNTTRLKGNELTVPLKVRDHVLGGFRVSKPHKDGDWAPEEIALIESLADQLGVALESARLYRDTQRRAAQERMLGEIASRFTQSLDLDAILQTAAQELGKLPGVVEASVHVGDVAVPSTGHGDSSVEMEPDHTVDGGS